MAAFRKGDYVQYHGEERHLRGVAGRVVALRRDGMVRVEWGYGSDAYGFWCFQSSLKKLTFTPAAREA